MLMARIIRVCVFSSLGKTSSVAFGRIGGHMPACRFGCEALPVKNRCVVEARSLEVWRPSGRLGRKGGRC